MAGRIVDLADPHIQLPRRIALDANVLVTRLVQPKIVSPDHLARVRRVRRFFALLKSQRSVGAVTSTALQEFLHAEVRASYSADLTTYAASIGGKRSWELLFKARPDLLTGYEAKIESVVAALSRINVTVIQPEELAPLPAGDRLETELVRMIVRYQLLSNDAAILLELRRAGLDAIVTEDPDLRRATSDFDVYTWL